MSPQLVCGPSPSSTSLMAQELLGRAVSDISCRTLVTWLCLSSSLVLKPHGKNWPSLNKPVFRLAGSSVVDHLPILCDPWVPSSALTKRNKKKIWVLSWISNTRFVAQRT
jgi:hypothetical protein